MQRSRSLGAGAARIFHEPKPVFEHTARAIPGYKGYIPGRTENYAGTYKKMTEKSQTGRHQTAFSKLEPEEQRSKAAYLDATWFTRKPKEPPRERVPDVRGIDPPAAGDFCESRIPHSSSTPKLSKQQSDIGGLARPQKGITAFTGFIPGFKSENVYGKTWNRSLQMSADAHLQANADERARCAETKQPRHPARDKVRATLLTKESTVVPEVDADGLREVPLHSNSYQDVRRGYSRCMFAGVDVAPAGRAPPFGRQDGFGRRPAPSPEKPHGYTGYVPGKIAQNVVGERICKTNEISKLLTYKNHTRVLQR